MTIAYHHHHQQYLFFLKTTNFVSTYISVRDNLTTSRSVTNQSGSCLSIGIRVSYEKVIQKNDVEFLIYWIVPHKQHENSQITFTILEPIANGNSSTELQTRVSHGFPPPRALRFPVNNCFVMTDKYILNSQLIESICIWEISSTKLQKYSLLSFARNSLKMKS